MRGTPLNYLVTAAVAGLLWVVGGVLVGNYLVDTVSLQMMTTQEFLSAYRLALAAAAAVGFGACAFWYAYGARSGAASALPAARRTWVGLLAGTATAAALVMATLVFVLRGEALSAADFAIIAAVVLLLTLAFFWLCTLRMSPRAVEYIPIGRR